MLKKNRTFLSVALFLITAALAGCSSGEAGITVKGSTTLPSETRPAGTDTPTLAPTSSETPTITPTVTKVPDLEIYNSRFVDLMTTSIGGIYLMGNIRNNTDTPIILPSKEDVFIFNVEKYQTFGDDFLHYSFGPLGMKPGIDIIRSNCILYPHEKGIIFFELADLDKMEGYSGQRDKISKYEGNLGITYTYTSTFKSKSDLPKTYHPKAENVKYHIADGNIYFEYDINVPAPAHKETEKGMVRGFLTMYDHDGNIINFLHHEDISYYLPWEHPYDNTVHMVGQSPDGDVPVHWQWFLRITDEDLQRVDHIELLFETQYEGICFEKRYEK